METTTLRDDSPSHRASVRIAIRPDAVARARTTVETTARRAQVPPDRIDDLVVAASEAVTNAVEAQQRAGATSPIEMTCVATDELVEVRVEDRGDGFDPGGLPLRPPLADPRHLDVERGWGIQLMRALVDEVVFDLAGPGTIVVLRIARG